MNLPPHPLLRPYVRGYGTLDDYHTPLKEEHRLYPECASLLVFVEGESYLGSPSELAPLPRVYVQRFDGGPLRLVSRGRTRMVGVELYPWAAVQLFGLEHASPFSVPSLPQSLVRSIGGLLRASQLERALAVLEDWLVERALRSQLVRTEASEAGARLVEVSGQHSIASLAEEVGLSVRQLERQFQRRVGMSPKQLARLARFETAQRRLCDEPSLGFTRLAHELGFADQAHFTREFRAFASLTPSLYLAEAQDFLRRQQGVAFLQA